MSMKFYKHAAAAELFLLCFACYDGRYSRSYSSPVMAMKKSEAQDAMSKPSKDSTEPKHNTEDYDVIVENPFLAATQNPLSTFSIDVDEAAYSNIRRILRDGNLPPAGAVRIEEMINYFDYEYPQPVNEDPFSVNTEIAECPW